MQTKDSNLLSVGVILPVFDETDSISEVTGKLEQALGPHLEEILIIVSPKSQDETKKICAELAKKKNIRMEIQEDNPGLGPAIKQGMASLKGSGAILWIDSDGEADPATAKLMVEAMVRKNADLVVASRWLNGRAGFIGYDNTKFFLNYWFRNILKVIFMTPLSELTYGYKLFRNKPILQQMNWESRWHDIATETTLKPLVFGFKPAQVPTVWTKRKEGVSKNPFKNNFRYVYRAAQIRLLSLTRAGRRKMLKPRSTNL